MIGRVGNIKSAGCYYLLMNGLSSFVVFRGIYCQAIIEYNCCVVSYKMKFTSGLFEGRQICVI